MFICVEELSSYKCSKRVEAFKEVLFNAVSAVSTVNTVIIIVDDDVLLPHEPKEMLIHIQHNTRNNVAPFHIERHIEYAHAVLLRRVECTWESVYHVLLVKIVTVVHDTEVFMEEAFVEVEHHVKKTHHTCNTPKQFLIKFLIAFLVLETMKVKHRVFVHYDLNIEETFICHVRYDKLANAIQHEPINISVCCR